MNIAEGDIECVPDDDLCDELNTAIRSLEKSTPGRTFIWAVLSICGIYNTQFTGDNLTFFMEGKRSVGLEIIDMLNEADCNIYPNLLIRKNKEDCK